MVAFFLFSTGRCATQTLTRYFADNLGDQAVVEHEPIGARWAPRIALRHPDLATLRQNLPDVDRHLDRIATTLAKGRSYIETGWPVFAWIPYLESFLGKDFRWAHLVRNPFYAAASMVTLDYYGPKRAITEYAALSDLVPTDRGVSGHHLAADWLSFSQFEKCLFHWLEINRYALELACDGLQPSLLVHYEELFGSSPSALRKLYECAGLGPPRIQNAERLDLFQKSTIIRPGLHSTRLCRHVEAVAAELGYNRQEIDFEGLSGRVYRRYSRPWRGARRTGLKTVFRFAATSLMRLVSPN
jgi:hypothetical protein